MGLRETRERVSKQFNWIEISTRMLTNDEEHLIYRDFDRNRPIETIDDYDKRSTIDRFQKFGGRLLVDGASGCDLSRCVIKRI